MLQLGVGGRLLDVCVHESSRKILFFAELWSFARELGNWAWWQLNMPWRFECCIGQAFILESCSKLRNDTYLCWTHWKSEFHCSARDFLTLCFTTDMWRRGALLSLCEGNLRGVTHYCQILMDGTKGEGVGSTSAEYVISAPMLILSSFHPECQGSWSHVSSMTNWSQISFLLKF